MPTLHLRLRVTSPGGIILHEHEEEGHSWTRNAWNAWNATMMDSGGVVGSGFGKGALSARQYGSDVVNSDPIVVFSRTPYTFAAGGFYNDTTTADYGILVGTSDSKFYTDDYMLYALIASGAVAGQLSYLAQAAPETVFDADLNKWSITHTRIFNNNSGAAITVKEVGLAYFGWGNLVINLMARDVLASPVVVANGAQLTVFYTITTGVFDACEADALPAFPALGVAGSGGYYMGQYAGWPHPHHILALICSSIDGDAADKKWKTTDTYPPNDAANGDINYGANNMAGLYAIGALSEIGAFCAAQNAALLGGFDDWYIPASLESEVLYTNRAAMPAGHEFTDALYWTSTLYIGDPSWAYYRNLVTNDYSIAAKSDPHRVRLVRRINIADWVADV